MGEDKVARSRRFDGLHRSLGAAAQATGLREHKDKASKGGISVATHLQLRQRKIGTLARCARLSTMKMADCHSNKAIAEDRRSRDVT